MVILLDEVIYEKCLKLSLALSKLSVSAVMIQHPVFLTVVSNSELVDYREPLQNILKCLMTN